ncbi:short-chain dehydrogenase [Alkalihalobacillus alcalophilus ATCC 27647 = CGMCC 1.3604]|uniref:Short-chain dehydrogenase n=1 Tax=Alkalihalobacillus alcalophilus ATCC 27647 = CGMCC 1.3604 TaxID=1218173 RepID=A0A094WFV7_ALKAL|nr:SDR family oxidoreductase [Alkalihalobacillus alcalophilus]KGA96659.1 short-chain dehydrogenase [Alkalihalobacillus alcalophilus ATCC 27647 = CGMCC 1.3604]MED1561830.1 SDR family oxidoreductase [Alkalihalobacillus alcalophilus]THG90995.1 short-chain dehydrogenase [Alkalihalobacillus alcalophilus ATCC 27647 = CGMCC 1.3604]
MGAGTAIVTGANSGMGLATTIELAKEGFHVVMACRNEQKAKEAREQAVTESGSDLIDVIPCDLGSINSIVEFVKEIERRYEQIDRLINNAGVVSLKKEYTTDGFEAMIGVNHLGHFLLSNLLLNVMKKSTEARIINVSSGAYKVGRIDLDDPHFNQRSFNVVKGYSQSKLANILFTLELAKRLEGTTVTTYSLHPGAVSTSLGVNRTSGFGKTIHKLLKPFFLTPKEGSATAIYLATEPQIEAYSGQFFYKEKPQQLTSKQISAENAKKLWDWSVEQVQLERD